MNLMTKIGGEFVNRKGVKPPLPDVDKIQFVEMIELDKDGYAEKGQGIRQTLCRNSHGSELPRVKREK